MKKIPPMRAFLASALSLALLTSGAFGADVPPTVSQLNEIRSRAEEYETSDRYAMAYRELVRYADMAEILADSGEISKSDADIAKGWRDHLEFSPEIFVGAVEDRGVFFGGDGVFAEGSSAVKLSIPYGAYAEEYYPMIPSGSKELLIYTELEITNEKTLRSIAFGKADDYIIKNLKQISRMEGRVYFSFCPMVNIMRETRTLAASFVSAYRYVSTLARRYAPNVEMVLSYGDVRIPGRDTLAKFYPGDEYVDVLGVELYHTYNKSYLPSPTAAYDSRGEYYDPVLSVLNIRKEMKDVAGKELPLIIGGCSFPWGGKAAISDWATEMRRFYELLPAAVPELVGVLYSNESTANGFCNLRQNADAMELYKECLSLPWYMDHSRKGSALKPISVADLTEVIAGKKLPLVLYAYGKFNGVPYRVFVDGNEISNDGIVFTGGAHTLALYITDNNCLAKMEYSISVAAEGKCKVSIVQADHDFNGNGFLDFGDAELLTAHVAKWNVDLGGYDPDVNEDGKVNLSDVSALRVRMKP